jgi:hypothetical protein
MSMGLNRVHADVGELQQEVRAFDVDLLRQDLINALLDLDVEYETERETLNKAWRFKGSKARLLTDLRKRHCDRRQPYMQQLMALPVDQ